MPVSLTQRTEWQALKALQKTIAGQPLTALLQDKDRFDRFTLTADGILFDFTRHPVTREVIGALCALAKACDVEAQRGALFSGVSLNTSEGRPALHTALRQLLDDTVMVNGQNIMPGIHDTLHRMKDISERVRSGAWKGHTGKPITDVLHIGIGGSDLGPRMVCSALVSTGPALHFVSNVDGAALDSTLRRCNPETTLLIIASKTFTTQETMRNAHSARTWLLDALPQAALASHFLALSTNKDAVEAFGIPADNMLPFGEWVGGRYSVWSAIGMPVCLSAGYTAFRAFLDGAHAMDRHFQNTPLDKNIPVIMALLDIWQRNFFGRGARAVIPYDARLSLLPDYLQQLEMESNGKSATRDGEIITGYETAAVVFGAPGTDAQHSFFQFLHQGTDIVPIDLIAACRPDHALPGHHDMLLANMTAQAQALSTGHVSDNATHAFPGNRPVSLWLMDALTPYHLGQLLAAYEHKVFVKGAIWNINSFDQFGVELGKKIAGTILAGETADLDAATQALLQYIHRKQKA